jgi:tetratricopeptide (TPR) repeat protein
MKSRIAIYTFATLISLPAYAAFTDVGPLNRGSAWTQVKTTVKSTVDRWLGYWRGSKATEEKTAGKSVATNPGHAASTAETSAPPAANPAPPVNEAARQMREQALFESKATGSSLKDVQSARDALKAQPLLKVAEPGRAGTSKLPKSKEGVPVSNWKQVKSLKTVPRLDIGRESLISSEDFKVNTLSWGVQKPSEFKRLPSPAPVSATDVKRALQIKVARAPGPNGLQAKIRTVGKPLSQEMVDKVKYTLGEVPEYKPLPYKPLSEEEMKMVAALILFEKGNHCHMIMGLFHQLAAAEKTRLEATYHLGACAAELKMHQSAFDNLAKVISSEDKDFAAPAMTALAKDLPMIYEKDFFKLVKGLKNAKALLTPETSAVVYYRLAKGAYRAGEYKTSGNYAEMVPADSEYADDARFLSGMNSFALGDKAGALRKLQALWATVGPRKGDGGNSNIRALTSVNLARMYFAQKKYDKALEHYMQVPKDHPLWVQALIEQGWTQLAIEDYSGAIGNMYSLHSPYFKAVYQPESFVVRTIGYLNICQYGDAYKTLSFLEKDYRDWYGKTSHYLERKNKPLDIYATVRNYIRGKSADDVEGVPFQVWREMAHRKDFLNLQAALNDKADETKRYEGVNEKIKTEKASIRWHAEQAKKRFDQWRAQIAKAKVDKSLAKNLDQWNASLKLERDLTVAYRFQLAILEQSRQGYLQFQSKSQARLDTESGVLSARAGELLLGHAKHMQREMARVLDNNEFLRYEVFSGSGENIRYQVAGGQVDGSSNRIPAHIKPTKMMNWNFDGEFWEDEIGSYRSSLQNNCPADPTVQRADRVPASASAKQARHSEEDEE